MSDGVLTEIDQVYRDFTMDGVESSGPNEPQKYEIRALLKHIMQAVGTVSLASVDVTKDTRANLESDLGWDADSIGLVYADGTDANNDLYIKSGASGAGSWTLTTRLHDAIGAAVAESVGIATAAAEDAVDAKNAVEAIADATTYSDAERLFVWKDALKQIVGSVGVDAGWNMLLSRIATTQGLTISLYEMVGPAPAFVFVDATGQILFSSDDTAGSDELDAARGSRDDLDARLSQSLDAYGSPLDEFNRNRMRRYRYLRRKILLGESARVVIALFGDSYTHSTTRYSTDLAQALIDEMGDGGGGYASCGFLVGTGTSPFTHGAGQPQYVNGNIRPASYPVSFNGAWTGTYATVAAPDTCCANSSSAGAEIRFGFPATPTLSGVDLFWIGTADGVMEYSWNGSSWTSINVQGTVGACSFAALSGVPGSGSGTLYLRVVSGTCRPAGVNWKSTATGVVVHKLAATGSTMAQLATQAAIASWKTGVAALSPTTAHVMHGPNDQGASALPDVFGANGAIVMAALDAAVPEIDRLWAMPPENQRTNTYAMPLYKAAAAPQAAALGVSFLDFQRRFGDPATPAEYGSGGAIPLFNADNLHPEPSTGGRVLVDGFLSFLNG